MKVDGNPARERDAPGGDHLVPELRGCYLQLAAIERDAKALVEGLTDRQLAWRENARTWSIADCLNHLVVTGRHSLDSMRRSVADARARGLLGRGPFRHGLLGNWLVRLMDAPPRIRVRAPKAYRPLPDQPVQATVAAFFLLQRELFAVLNEANGIDLGRVKVENPVTRWFRLSLGQELAFTAAHERRHLWQAAVVRSRLH